MMRERDFVGKTALVTGGSRGIGLAISLRLASHGANVALSYLSRHQDALAAQDRIEREGVRCLLLPGDVSDRQVVESWVAKTTQHLGPIGLLVANAGLHLLESHETLSWESWRKILSVNLDGAFLCIMAVKDQMLANRYGRIVCLSSLAALQPRALQIHYATSKAAVIALAKCWAQALAPHVRVNCIAPGLIETEMTESLGPIATERVVTATPLARVGKPEEIADAAYFLLSDQSSFITGHTLVVSGGRVMVP
ncbi:MAG: SDR family NAD(P)-dependent oxidoreductase [Acidobacteriota bacterium]